MKIQLLIATSDQEYADALYTVLAKRQADIFELGLCSNPAKLEDMLLRRTYDICLLEPEEGAHYQLERVRLPLILQGSHTKVPEELGGLPRIKKYQRISALVSEVLDCYAEAAKSSELLGQTQAKITAVWSPVGGVGKTSVALAYATRAAMNGQRAAYLNLENFCSLGAFLKDEGKSISSVLERIDQNPSVQMRSIRQQDAATGVFYYGAPENYDDINILGKTELVILLNAAASGVDELIVDLPSFCDERIECTFERANQVFLVTDLSVTAQRKLNIFMAQNSTYDDIRHKAVFVCNKGACGVPEGAERCVSLPHVQSADPAQVFKTLSASQFQPV